MRRILKNMFDSLCMNFNTDHAVSILYLFYESVGSRFIDNSNSFAFNAVVFFFTIFSFNDME